MEDKLLFVLGGEARFKNFFAINALSGGRTDLLDYLRAKRRVTQRITVICDVQDEKEFPVLPDDEVWRFFSTTGQNRVLFVLHKRNPAIELAVTNRRQDCNISGPLFWGATLKDETPLSDVENELLLFAVFRVFPDLQTDLNGVLAARVFLPEILLKLPEQMNVAYGKKLHAEAGQHFEGAFDLLREDLELSKYSIKRSVLQPFNVDLLDPQEVAITTNRVEKVIDDCFTDENITKVFSEIARVRDTKLIEKINQAEGAVRLHGASQVLNRMENAEEECRKKKKAFVGTIQDVPGFISQVCAEAKTAIARIIESQVAKINELIAEYKKIWKFFLFLSHNRVMHVLGIVMIPLIAAVIMIFLHADILPSFFVSSCIWIVIAVVAWTRAKSRKQREILEQCEQGNTFVINSLNENFKKIPILLWQRNMDLMDAKILKIYGEYIGRSLASLRMLTETRPQDITGDIFKTRQRLVFFIPSNPVDGTNLDFSDFDDYLGVEKKELIEYFEKKLISLASASRMNSLAQQHQLLLSNFREFFDQPDIGLIWSEKEVVDFRYHTIGKYLFRPPSFTIEPLTLGWSRIADFQKEEGGMFNMVVLMAFFTFKEED